MGRVCSRCLVSNPRPSCNPWWTEIPLARSLGRNTHDADVVPPFWKSMRSTKPGPRSCVTLQLLCQPAAVRCFVATIVSRLRRHTGPSGSAAKYIGANSIGGWCLSDLGSGDAAQLAESHSGGGGAVHRRAYTFHPRIQQRRRWKSNGIWIDHVWNGRDACHGCASSDLSCFRIDHCSVAIFPT